MNNAPGPTNSLKEYQQTFGTQTAQSPAQATYLSGATSTQGVAPNPPVDYSSPQFQTEEQINAEIADADAYNRSTTKDW